MTLVRWQPYKGLSSYEKELDSFFDCYGSAQCEGVFSPAADIRESESAYVITLECAGVKKEDVTLELKEDILLIRGEKKTDVFDEKVKHHSSERRFGKFEKRFSVPSAIQSEAIKAEFENGVLRVVIPKAEEAKPKQIKID